MKLLCRIFLTTFVGLTIALVAPAMPVFAQGPTLDVSMDFGSGSTVLNVESGVEFTYFINYRCASALQNCASTVVTDTLPAALQFIDATAPPSHMTSINFDSGTNTVTFNFVDPLPAGSTGLLEVKARFPAGTLPGTSAVNFVTSSTTGGVFVSNTTTATAQGQFEMTANKIVNGDVDNGVVGSAFDTTYLLQICSPDSAGGVRLTNPEVTDPLPAQATYVSSTPAGTYITATHTVTWTYAANGGTLPNVIDVGGCYSINLVVRFEPDGPDGIPGNADDPIVGNVVNNQMTVTGTPEDGSPPVTLTLPGPYGLTLSAPTYNGSFSKTSSSPSSYTGRGTEELPGGPVRYDISYANTGTVTNTNVIITDTVPVSHTVAVIDVNPVITPLNAYYELNNSGTWVPFPGNPYAAPTTVNVATDLGVAGNAISGIRWNVGDMPYGSPTWTGGFTATLDSALTAGTVLTNCADLGTVWDNSGVPTSATAQQCATVTILASSGRAIPRPTKSVNAGPYLPGEVMDITLTASNAAVAHNPVEAPIILADLLPEGLEIVVADTITNGGYRPALITDTWYTLLNADGAPAPTATLTLSGTQMLARWEWGPPYQQLPGHNTEVTFKARVKDGTPPGTINNRAMMMWKDTTTNPLLCTGDRVYTDTLDLDNDGLTNDTGCQTSGQPVNVSVFLAMDSEKFVWGELDSDWNKLGWTVPGGYVDWKMVITNTSNVTTTNLMVYDILPYIGDTGVIATGENRDSAWRPNMQAPVTAPSGVPLTISYSQSPNPCRADIVPGGPAGCVDDWTTTFPADATSVQALKLDFCDSSGSNCLELPPDTGSGNGGVVTFTWHMVAPNNAPYNQIAWNSFGFTAQGSGKQLLPAEPIRVGIRLSDTVPFNLGDYVWLDVAGQQNDGIQQPEEPGINGARVELHDSATGNLLDYRITGPDQNGKPGYYLFANITSTNYYLRFFPPISSPLTYTATLPNQGGNDALDSDGETSGNDATYGAYSQTAVINLITDTLDWDQGYWVPTDYGDAPQQSGVYSYPVQAATQPISAALAGRHIISGNIYLGNRVDAELDGQPSADALGDDTTLAPDDEDGVQFTNYLGTVAQPTGVMVIGQNNTVAITATIPATRTGYLNAWLDFNGDGDWDDAGEQIVTDRASSSTFNLTVPVPSTAISGTTYARFRFSTQPGLTPYLTAPDGEVEDYRVQLINPPVKSIAATSESHTGGADLAIGEIVRYRLVVPIPEGIMPNFTITDTLPAGLQFLNDGTAATSFTGTNVTSTTFTIGGGPFGDGTDPVFSFGTLTNGDADPDEEDVVVEFNALVLNVSGNNNGNTRNNRFTVSYDTFSATSNVVPVQIVEPNFNIAKTIVTPPVDVGDTVVYQLDVTGSVTDAFDLLITDTLISDLTLGSFSVTAPGYTTVDTSSSNIPANYIDVRLDTLQPGDTASVLVTATVKIAVPVGQTIPNTVTLVYSSLPLTGTVGNPTGSDTPGASGAATGERNGSGGVNDHTATDAVNVTLLEPAILKGVTPSSGTIGNLITYTMRITLPEGTTQGLVVEDDIPAGQEYRSHQIISTAAASSGDLTNDFNGTLPAPVVTAPGGDGVNTTFNFGDTVTTQDGNSTNNTFLIRVTTAVLDAAGNQNGALVDNLANLSYTQNGITRTVSSTIPVTIVEPIVQIGKTAAVVTGNPQALDYTVTVTNSGDATAFGLTITDHTPAGTTVSNISNGGQLLPDNRTITWTIASLAASASQNLTYRLTLTDVIYASNLFTNTAMVTNTSLTSTISGVRQYVTSTVHTFPLPMGRIGDVVWLDVDYDGVQGTSPAETGINSTVVNLFNAATGAFITTTTTAPDGSYIFEYLPLGVTYTVQLAPSNFSVGGVLQPYAMTRLHVGTSDADSDADQVATFNGNGYAITTTLTSAITEDLTLDYGFTLLYDWGDLPESPYPTTAAQNGARHIILPNGNPTLGAVVDDEIDGQPNATATGDDIARVPDDEDGVQLMTPLVAGQVATFTITATNTSDAGLYAWMDFNGDGDFTDTGEQIFTGQSLATGANVLTITVPTVILSNIINARFRYSTQPTLTPTGEAQDGEVEDYQFNATHLVSVGDLVWFDYNNNGIYEPSAGESGASGVTVELFNAGDTAGVSTPVATATTSATGRYLFLGVPEGGYFVHIPPAEFAAGQPLYGYDSSLPTQANPNTDQNEDVDENGVPVSGTADVAGVNSGVITVTVGTEPTADDVTNLDPTTPDTSSNLTVDFGFYPAHPGITVIKQVETSPNVNQATVRYTITVTNSGQINLFPVVLTDTLPAEMQLVPGTFSPISPTVISGQTLGWNNIVVSALQPGQSTQVGFDVQITTQITGTYINVVTGTGVYTGGVVTDTGSVPIAVRDPAVSLSKNIVPPGAVNGIITYTIRVTNTGPSELDIIPLFDYYDPTYLTFTVSTPPEDYRVSGEIRWNDLTQSFGRNLLPGENFVVTTVFDIIRNVTQTVNTAEVSSTEDIFNNLAPNIGDSAVISNTPTAVDWLDAAFVAAQGNNVVELYWQTTSEVDTIGFFIYRSETGSRADAVVLNGGNYLSAQGQGGGGASYAFTDADVVGGATYTYWVSDVDRFGVETFHGPRSVTFQANGDVGSGLLNHVYLPLILK